MKNTPIFNVDLEKINAIQIKIEEELVDGEEIYAFYLYLTDGNIVKVESSMTSDEIAIQKQFATIKSLIKQKRLYYIKPVMIVNYENIESVEIAAIVNSKTGKVDKKKAKVTITFKNGVVIKRVDKEAGRFANFLLSRGIPTTLKGYERLNFKAIAAEMAPIISESDRTAEEAEKEKKKTKKAAQRAERAARKAARKNKNVEPAPSASEEPVPTC